MSLQENKQPAVRERCVQDELPQDQLQRKASPIQKQPQKPAELQKEGRTSCCKMKFYTIRPIKIMKMSSAKPAALQSSVWAPNTHGNPSTPGTSEPLPRRTRWGENITPKNESKIRAAWHYSKWAPDKGQNNSLWKKKKINKSSQIPGHNSKTQSHIPDRTITCEEPQIVKTQEKMYLKRASEESLQIYSHILCIFIQFLHFNKQIRCLQMAFYSWIPAWLRIKYQSCNIKVQ